MLESVVIGMSGFSSRPALIQTCIGSVAHVFCVRDPFKVFRTIVRSVPVLVIDKITCDSFGNK